MKYKLVPVEPTEAMLYAGYAARLRPDDPLVPGDAYRAMLEAAPVIEQEPVAYVSSDDLYNLPYDRTATIQTNRSERMTPLYAAPVAQQELSEDEIASIFNRHGHHLFEEPDVRCYDPAEMQSVARAILAAKGEK